MTCEWLSQPCRGNTRACAFLVTNPPVAACVGKAKRHDAHARSLPPREVELLSTAGNALRLVNSLRHVVSPHHFRPAEVDLDTSRKTFLTSPMEPARKVRGMLRHSRVADNVLGALRVGHGRNALDGNRMPMSASTSTTNTDSLSIITIDRHQVGDAR